MTAHALMLWRLWRSEREDPAPFYAVLARDVVGRLERQYGSLSGQKVLDVGCARPARASSRSTARARSSRSPATRPRARSSATPWTCRWQTPA
jgi:hypothetical protein